MQYNVGESEALLCRFGEAGVGASSLLNYFNHQKVNSIEFLLNYTAPEATQESDLAVVPSGHKAPGGIGQFIVESNPNPSALQPGIRLVMSPRVQVSAYCRQRGGKPVQLVHSGDKTPLKACIFSDFSGIDAITLFKGHDDPRNAQLVEALRSLR